MTKTNRTMERYTNLVAHGFMWSLWLLWVLPFYIIVGTLLLPFAIIGWGLEKAGVKYD